MTSPPAPPGPVVDAAWLAGHVEDVVVADVRWYLDGRSGRAAHAAGHVPGAVFVDLDIDLAAPATATGGRHPLPGPAAFAAALGRLGIGPRTPVVAYDDAGGSVAARLWWLRHLLGEPTAVLDGGLAAWTGPLEPGPVEPRPVTREAAPWPADRLADTEAVAGRDPAGVLLDARAAGRFTGEEAVAADPRPGHVPGARSAPWVANLGPDGRFLAPDALRDRFVALGVDGDRDVIAYCGSGVTACHDLLALHRAGLGARARLYPGSWSAWAADPARPVETGP